jgi:hypothetical protein
MKSALIFIGFFLLAMGLFWAGQGAGLIRWPAESFMVNARQWIYYGGGTAVIRPPSSGGLGRVTG